MCGTFVRTFGDRRANVAGVDTGLWPFVQYRRWQANCDRFDAKPEAWTEIQCAGEGASLVCEHFERLDLLGPGRGGTSGGSPFAF